MDDLKNKDKEIRLFKKRIKELEKTEIHRVEIEKALSQSVKEMIALNTLGKQVSSRLSLDQVVDAALDNIVRILHPDLSLIFLREKDNLLIQGERWKDARFRHKKKIPHKVGECLCGLAVREKKSLYSVDINNDPRCTWTECKESGLVSLAVLLLTMGDEIIGVLALASTVKRDFSLQAHFLETMSKQIAIGMQNALLYEELKDHAKKLEDKIKEHKRTQTAKRALEKNYQAIFNGVNDAIMIHDAQTGQPLDINLKMEELLGYNRQEFLCMTVSDWTTGDPSAIQKKAMKRMREAAQGKPQLFEWHAVKKNKKLIWAEVNLKHAVIGGQKRILAVVRDITERKRAENELRKLKNQLEKKVHEKTKELKERVNELERFYDATVDRELRMKEMRDEIIKLKKVRGGQGKN